MSDQPWRGSSIRYNRPCPGEGRQSRHWDIDLGRPIDELRHDLSTLPLNPPSLVRSLDAFEDSLAEGLRDEETSVRAVLRNWTSLWTADAAYWQLLSRVFFAAVDEAMVGWHVDEFAPNREPIPEVTVAFVRNDAPDLSETPSDCVAMVRFDRALRDICRITQERHFLDLTGCRTLHDCSDRFVESGLVNPGTRAETQAELLQALRTRVFRDQASVVFSVHWTGRLGSDHPGRAEQKEVERAVACVLADLICEVEERAQDALPAPILVIDVDSPNFDMATVSSLTNRGSDA